jgi:HAD superfamily hydrolase (TIGR01549 family)
LPPASIFDIDRTLIDSVDLHAMAWREALQHYGHDIPLADIRHQIGKGGDQLLPVFLPDNVLRRQGKEIEEYRSQLFKEKYLSKVRAFPQVRQLFQRLRADGLRIALASSAKGDELATYERIAQIDDLVEAETSSEDVDRSKPHPDIFQAALSRLGSPRVDEVAVVGDSPYDAEAAVRAQLQIIIGVLCGGFPEEELRAAGCIAVFRDPAHLLRSYDQSPLAQLRTGLHQQETVQPTPKR